MFILTVSIMFLPYCDCDTNSAFYFYRPVGEWSILLLLTLAVIQPEPVILSG